MSAPQEGQRIRVPIEGTVRHVGDAGWFIVSLDSGREAIIPGDAPWGALPGPEPVWNDGDVVRDATGITFVYGRAAVWRSVNGASWLDCELARPLVRLVPEVKP